MLRLGGAVVERLSSEYPKLELKRGYRFCDSQAVLGYLLDSTPPPLLHSVGTGGRGVILVKSTLGKLAT